MTSNFNDFKFNQTDWDFSEEETKGMTEGAAWLKLKSNPSIRALFKPNPEFNNTNLNLAQVEYESSQIRMNILCLIK
jgi:hypothetical protein